MITKECFGTLPDGRAVELYTISSGAVTAKISTRGAALVSLCVPDRSGAARETVLGYDTLDGYRSGEKYMSAIVGRFANRLAGAQFPLDGEVYHVTANNGVNSLHGGGSFDCALWDAAVEDDVLALRYLSPDGENGYPGELAVTVRYRLDGENALHISYFARSDRKTICNLTNHAYFNFTGGQRDVLAHELWLNAERYTAVDGKLIPTGDVPVAGTKFDFRQPRQIGDASYDNNFVLLGGSGAQATLYEPQSGIFMQMFTDRPGVQLYVSGMLKSHAGRGGAYYGVGMGVCLETQLSPNCPNRPGFDGYTVEPGKPWRAETAYRFSVV